MGIVSEGDLMRRIETDTKARRHWWLELLGSNAASAADFVRLHSNKITDAMTREVITAGPETLLSEVAVLLEKYSIKRVPIVRNGKVVGIVSRANLCRPGRAFGPAFQRPPRPVTPPFATA